MRMMLRRVCGTLDACIMHRCFIGHSWLLTRQLKTAHLPNILPYLRKHLSSVAVCELETSLHPSVFEATAVKRPRTSCCFVRHEGFAMKQCLCDARDKQKVFNCWQCRKILHNYYAILRNLAMQKFSLLKMDQVLLKTHKKHSNLEFDQRSSRLLNLLSSSSHKSTHILLSLIKCIWTPSTLCQSTWHSLCAPSSA